MARTRGIFSEDSIAGMVGLIFNAPTRAVKREEFSSRQRQIGNSKSNAGGCFTRLFVEDFPSNANQAFEVWEIADGFRNGPNVKGVGPHLTALDFAQTGRITGLILTDKLRPIKEVTLIFFEG